MGTVGVRPPVVALLPQPVLKHGTIPVLELHFKTRIKLITLRGKTFRISALVLAIIIVAGWAVLDSVYGPPVIAIINHSDQTLSDVSYCVTVTVNSDMRIESTGGIGCFKLRRGPFRT